jgi:thiamine-phosphate pyrophosphorylase
MLEEGMKKPAKKPTKKPLPIPPPEAAKLVLLSPSIAHEDALPYLLNAVTGNDVAAIILQIHPVDIRTRINLMKIVIPPLQRLGVACIVADVPEVATKSGADGIHAKTAEQLAEALGYRPAMMVTYGGFTSFDESMTAGEQGVDALLFEDEYLPKRLDKLQHWAEIFEIPAIGYATCLEEVKPLADTKAEFIALGAWVFETKSPNKTISDALVFLK